MSRVKFDTRKLKAFTKLIENLQTVIDRKVARDIGDTVVKEMKDQTSKGISPIRGKVRFDRYKSSGQKNKYPLSVKKKFPRKRATPVNLRLSGEFMSKLTSKVKPGSMKGGFKASVGFFDGLSILKESGHRAGVNKQPKRPVIPTEKEGFNKTIERIIRDKIGRAIKKAIKRFQA